MMNIFIWSAVVCKCEHFHGDAAISPKPVGQRRRRLVASASITASTADCTASSKNPDTHVDCTVSRPTALRVACPVGAHQQHPSFLSSPPAWVKISVPGIGVRDRIKGGKWRRNFCCFALVPHPGLVTAAYICGDGRSAESFVVKKNKQNIYNGTNEER